jgi:hypothetical protein
MNRMTFAAKLRQLLSSTFDSGLGMAPATVALAVVFALIVVASQAAQAQSPKITSVSQISTQEFQTIVITGSGFGTQAPYNGDSNYISFSDVNRNWEAGFAGPCPIAFHGCGGYGYIDDALGLIVESWNDSSIVLGGFTGPWGSYGYGCAPTCQLAMGDVVQIYVWNPQSGNGPSFVTTAATPLQLVGVTPCRLVDTRNATGEFGGPALQGNSTRSFVIPDNRDCRIPSSAAAYSLNVTVVPHGSLGYLTIWPTGEGQPYVSTLNSDGRVKANAAIVPAGASGAVSVYVTDAADVVLDIDGYFVPAGNSTLAFYPLPPCRVADTRNAVGDLGGPYLTGEVPRDFPVLEASGCNLPNSAKAYSLNFTAVPHGPLGFLTVWPYGQSQPTVSTLNSYSGQLVANAAILPAGTGGKVTTFASNDTDLVIDINGYFAATGQGGLSLYPAVPCRGLDTSMVGNGQPFSGELTVDVLAGPCGIPSAAQAYVFNATVVPSGSLGFLTVWPDGSTQPLVSTLNAADGAVTSNMAIVPTGDKGKIDAYATGLTQLLLDISSYFAP